MVSKGCVLEVKIHKLYAQNKDRINEVRKYADENKKNFGFLPSSVYEELALKDQVWIAVSKDNQSLAGYLIFGGTYPYLKVFQLFVHPDFRKFGIGKLLIKELIGFGKAHSYLAIHAKVASELPANKFWENQNFLVYKQGLGGTSKSVNKRKMNYRSFDLGTPDLLSQEDKPCDSAVRYPNKPIISLPVYAIDLNPLFDITSKREQAPEAILLIGQGFGGLFKLCVTPEFKKELERHTSRFLADPILEIARALPTLPEHGENELAQIHDDLKKIIFPNKKSDGKSAANIESDIAHLSYCCMNNIDGFITREKALLKHNDELFNKYNVSIYSPDELTISDDVNPNKAASSSGITISLESTNNKNRIELKSFLTALDIDSRTIEFIEKRPIGVNNIKEILLFKDDVIVGFGSWNKLSQINSVMDLHLYVDESHQESILGIDHIIESAIRDTCPKTSSRVDLFIRENQGLTKSIAIKRGFVVNHDKSLTKVTFNGYIMNECWSRFKRGYEKMSDIILPASMPKMSEIENTGIAVSISSADYMKCLSLMEFETLISPGMILYENRGCLLIPIKEPYANELLGDLTRQQSIIPSKNTTLLSEKAYFKSPNRIDYFKKGGMIAFYVSGTSSIQEIVGTARITFTGLLSIDQINISLSQQGVLSDEELSSKINTEGLLHAITFDNYKPFSKRVSFKRAKELGIISGANLTTVEKLSNDMLTKLLEESCSI